MKKQKETICGICGVNQATTREHVPPKSIFLNPKPSDLITIPACFNCNNATSESDERFRLFLGLHVARFSKQGEQLFKEGVISTTRHNNRYRAEILSSGERVLFTTPAGVINGSGVSIPWDSKAHDNTIEKIIRGLFFHHYKKIIANNAQVTVNFFNSLPKLEIELYENSIGNGIFRYAYNKVEESDYASIWLFNFYDGHWAGGTVLEKDFSL